MALFVAENPVLGIGTTLQELGGIPGNPAGSPVTNAYKPLTRLIITYGMNIVEDPTADIVGPIFWAPWKCKIIRASFCAVTASSASVTLSLYNVPLASQPEAATSGNLLTNAL